MMLMLSRVINRSKDYLLFNPLWERYWLDKMRGKITCLLYHRVDTADKNEFLTRGGSPAIAPDELAEDLGYFVERGARFFTFRDVLEAQFPEPTEIGIAVSFDDCFLDNYTNGLDVLQKLGVRATLLQSTAMVEAQAPLWEHRLYWHTRDDAQAAGFRRIAQDVLASDLLVENLSIQEFVAYLRESVPFEILENILTAADSELTSPEELKAVANCIYPTRNHLVQAQSHGHEIGSHGHRHYKRANISAELFEDELRLSFEILSSMLGGNPVSFSFPFDSYRAEDTEVCARLFSVVATCDRRRIEKGSDLRSLPRFSWPGSQRNSFRHRRWLWTGAI